MKSIWHTIFGALGIWNKIVFVLTTFLSIVLLLSYLSPLIHPETSVLFAYLGLVFPVLFLFNAIILLYWLLLRKKHYILPLIVFLLGVMPIRRFYQVTFFQPTLLGENDFKIMSYNVRLFDLYNWTGNVKTKNKIIDFLEKTAPDIICFQEYYKGGNAEFKVGDTIQHVLDLNYRKESFTAHSIIKGTKKKNYFGLAIFSRFPILDSGSFHFQNDPNNHCIYADILRNEDTIRIYNAHLGSLKLQQADYHLIGGDGNKRWPHQKKARQNFLNRMTLAYKKRAQQVATVMEHIRYCKHPIILCTDLNDIPQSYAYRCINKRLYDAFVSSGSGIGGTYVAENFFNSILPINRIDYVFTSSDIQSTQFVTHQEKLSDHKAISCRVEVTK